MRTLTLGIGLFAATVSGILFFPRINAGTTPLPPDKPITVDVNPISGSELTTAPEIEVVFVLDTTSSMSGLIQTAKEKIWSIATTMTSAQQMPNIRIGLVAFRDRGDTYVTKTIDLSDDIDSVYASLMDFEAQGGGDGPESVNKGLHDAISNISWSQNPNSYQTVFLVGDAPPHMDYKNDVKYIQTVTQAARNGIIVNTIQCGENRSTEKVWRQIAQIGGGNYFQVEQSGGSLTIHTPYDEQLATLSAQLDDTRLYYGTTTEKAKMQEKVEATIKLHEGASVASRARRGVFNSSSSGKRNSLGDKELVDAVSSGRLDIEELKAEELPFELQKLDAPAQRAAIQELARDRDELHKKIRVLSEKRETYIGAEVAKAGPSTESLDYKLYEAVRDQGAKAGLTYESGPEY